VLLKKEIPVTRDVALMIFAKLKQSAEALDDIVDIGRRELEQRERWPIFQAIGEIYAIQHDQSMTR
jgi:hypothetical protein